MRSRALSRRTAPTAVAEPEGSQAPTAFRHDALPYAGHDEFVSLATDFLGAGLAAGEAGMLLTRRERLDDVRSALGSAAEGVRFLDMDSAGHNPALIFSVLNDFASAHPGRRVRALGEPIYDGRTPAQRAEAELHEVLLNTGACRSWNMWLACPFDTDWLDDRGQEQMRLAHPADGRDLENVAAAKFADPLPPRPDGAETFPIDGADLGAIRSVLRTAARMSGLSDERVEAFVCAVNEVVTNSIRHGRGPAEFALWSVGDSLVCEVHDSGRIRDPFAGRVAPALGDTSGRGLWLVNHLCDLVQVRGPSSGTCVRMHIER
jgi:anti-sigma regulatory factor (Ser/Thr protein kinase)